MSEWILAEAVCSRQELSQRRRGARTWVQVYGPVALRNGIRRFRAMRTDGWRQRLNSTKLLFGVNGFSTRCSRALLDQSERFRLVSRGVSGQIYPKMQTAERPTLEDGTQLGGSRSWSE